VIVRFGHGLSKDEAVTVTEALLSEVRARRCPRRVVFRCTSGSYYVRGSKEWYALSAPERLSANGERFRENGLQVSRGDPLLEPCTGGFAGQHTTAAP